MAVRQPPLGHKLHGEKLHDDRQDGDYLYERRPIAMEYDGFHASRDDWRPGTIVVSELTNTTGCGPFLEPNGFVFHFSFFLFNRLPLAPPCPPLPLVQLALGNCTILRSGSDIHSFGVKASIGGTEICLTPSTVTNDTFLTTSPLCEEESNRVDAEGIIMTESQCSSRRGYFITDFQVQDVSADAIRQNNPSWTNLGDNEIGTAAKTTLKLYDQFIDLDVVLITSGKHFTASHLGLGSASPFLRKLKKLGLISSLAWGINVGSQSVLSPRRGSLVLGGYDQASLVSSSFSDYPITNNPIGGRVCPLQVTVHNLTWIPDEADRDKINKVDIITKASEKPWCIEP